MKRKINAVIIITSAMFGVGISIMSVALICMSADIHIWHKLIPRAIVFLIVTSVVFVFSLAIRHYSAKAAKTHVPTIQAENPPMFDKKAKASRFCGIAALVCFYVALSCNFASGLCSGLAQKLTFLFCANAAIIAAVLAMAWILLGKFSTGQKFALLHLISIPILFIIITIVLIAFVVFCLFYFMLMVWAHGAF